MKTEMTDEAFGELYDSLFPKTEAIRFFAWNTLSVSEKLVARALHDRAYDAGHAKGEQDGYEAAEAALREDLGALPWRTGSRNTQTVYDANDRQVASAQTGEIARRNVEAMNAPEEDEEPRQ